jgi:Ca2+-binding EF-hand superfamily protein
MRTEAIDRVQLIFDLLDADGSGHLDAEDFELMGRRVVHAAKGSDTAGKEAMLAAFRRYWTTLAAELDTNNDNRITFEEYSGCVLSPERFDDTIEDFAVSLAALGDPDGDGLIERDVFVALMSAIGFERANIDALFDAYEPNDDDEIAVPVWVTGIRDYYSPEKTGTGDLLVGRVGA